jgi:hypothetical protein
MSNILYTVLKNACLAAHQLFEPRQREIPLISIHAVHSYCCFFVTLKNIFPGWHNKQVNLNRDYRKNFYKKIGKTLKE